MIIITPESYVDEQDIVAYLTKKGINFISNDDGIDPEDDIPSQIIVLDDIDIKELHQFEFDYVKQ